MNVRNKTLILAMLVSLIFTLATPYSYAESEKSLAGIGFNIPEKGYVFLSYENYFSAVVNGSGNQYYDYFFKPGTKDNLKYEICIVKDSSGRHVSYDSYFSAALKLEDNATFKEIMGQIPKEENLDEVFLSQLKEAKIVNEKLEFEPYIEPSNPRAILEFTPDENLGEGFNLGKIKVSVLDVPGADKYSVQYSVTDGEKVKYVTTKLAQTGKKNPDLIQYTDSTEIVINVYDVNKNIVKTFNKDQIEIVKK